MKKQFNPKNFDIRTNYHLQHSCSWVSFSTSLSNHKANVENSTFVKPPFVKESPFSMECKLYDIIHLGNKPASGNLILGEIVNFHISKDIIDEKNIVDPHKLDAISRLGGSWYSKSKDGLFEYKKPRHIGIGFDSIPEKILKSKIITANELSILSSVESKPEIILNVYSKYKGEKLSSLENACKKFIEKDEKAS